MYTQSESSDDHTVRTTHTTSRMSLKKNIHFTFFLPHLLFPHPLERFSLLDTSQEKKPSPLATKNISNKNVPSFL
jgi:hypothetical protein